MVFRPPPLLGEDNAHAYAIFVFVSCKPQVDILNASVVAIVGNDIFRA